MPPPRRNRLAGRTLTRDLMQLPRSVNQSLSRIASVAEGARSDGWVKNLPLVVSAVLVVLLAWQLVQLSWAAGGGQQPGRRRRRYRPGVDWTRHGPRGRCPRDRQCAPVRRQPLQVPDETDPNSVAASQMQLVLVGTIANSDPEGLRDHRRKSAAAKVYAVGKTITGARSCTRSTWIASSWIATASSRRCCCRSGARAPA